MTHFLVKLFCRSTKLTLTLSFGAKTQNDAFGSKGTALGPMLVVLAICYPSGPW